MKVLSLVIALSLTQPGEWKSITPKAAGFSVQLPGAPMESQRTAKHPLGIVEIRTLVLTAPVGVYVASVSEFPEAVVPAGQEAARLDQARDGAVKEAKGRLDSEKKLTIEGKPAREIRILTFAGHAARVRLIADRHRLYQVMVVGNSTFLESPDASRFLDSFRLVGDGKGDGKSLPK